MIDYKRLLLNLLFFFIGILIPLLAFKSAFAECIVLTPTDVSSGLDSLSFDSSDFVYSPVTGRIMDVGGVWYGPSSTCYSNITSNPTFTSTDRIQWYWGGSETCQYTGAMGRWLSDEAPITSACPSEPITCGNGVKDGDETGIDCGGSCIASCVIACPPGTEELLGTDGQPACFWTSVTDDYGNCPPGTTSSEALGIAGACYKEYDYVSAAGTIEVPTVSGPSMGTGTFSVVEFETPESIVNNGDGTSTGTVTTTTTDSNGNSTTTTKTTDYTGENGTGDIAGTTTQTDKDVAPEENPENYDYQLEEGEYDGEISSDDIPDKESITELVQGFMSDNPVVTTITGSGIDLESSLSQLTWTYPPTGTDIVFDLSDRGGVLSYMGFILVFLSGISSYYIIVGRQ